MTTTIDTIQAMRKPKPRLVIELDSPELLTQLRIKAFKDGKYGYKALVLDALANQYPEFADVIRQERENRYKRS